jgi:hypothetical protein
VVLEIGSDLHGRICFLFAIPGGCQESVKPICELVSGGHNGKRAQRYVFVLTQMTPYSMVWYHNSTYANKPPSRFMECFFDMTHLASVTTPVALQLLNMGRFSLHIQDELCMVVLQLLYQCRILQLKKSHVCVRGRVTSERHRFHLAPCRCGEALCECAARGKKKGKKSLFVSSLFGREAKAERIFSDHGLEYHYVL